MPLVMKNVQSVIQETLNAVKEDNISQMENALKTIWEQNNLSVSLIMGGR